MPTQLGKHFFLESSFVFGLRIDYLSPTLYLTDILILLIIIFSFKDIFKIVFSKYKKNLGLFLLFILFLLTQVSISKNPTIGIYSIFKLLEFVYLGIFVYLNFKILNKKIMVILLSLGMVFETLLALLQYLNQGSLQGIFYFLGERSFNSQTPMVANASINNKLILRPYATFPHPNVLAGYLALSGMLLFYFKKHLDKFFLSTVLIISTIGIFVSLSRVATVIWIGFLFIYFLTYLLRKYKKQNLSQSFFRNNFWVGVVTV
ncbi:MAG: hypothetical protein HYT06_00655, partial [Candidatus Levybacteria bacterium]|nr:hypothetical protein [Candidatus Levybacteria bacterium]